MADANPNRRAKTPQHLPLPDMVALVLQGGGALGAFQAGVFEALADTAIEIDWVAGISIGAVNAAIIAGNPPESRVAKLRSFWNQATSALPSLSLEGTDAWQQAVHLFSAGYVAATGVPGFFNPRLVPPVFAAPGSADALSFYDSAPLAATLDAHVDWQLLNDGPMRLSVGAVNVESGNFRFFDTTTDRIDARHIMASGALPPGLPPVEIDGCLWWDGGIVSNTPLTHVLDHQAGDMLVFQVDLFPARGARPHTIMDVYSREKDIRYSSRTRQVTDQLLRLRKERELIRKVLDKLPPALSKDDDVAALRALAAERAVSVVHLIYRARGWEGGARDFEFSRDSMDHHWDEGRLAVASTLEKDALIASNIVDGKTASFDLAK
ncbi:patatin-like phospholipase family protein [Allosphingosinicella indica]|uniref:NTE family protein n=1 Tax=Allosphingosinicella indica TaxID=941907 RepID=A0A1X7GG46_9SPHN|nr:patatin-like phospholipase family protein [Allosphingosinicella indica]SMF68844.1 NTE family protein [Allosphingosinicella indica]